MKAEQEDLVIGLVGHYDLVEAVDTIDVDPAVEVGG